MKKFLGNLVGAIILFILFSIQNAHSDYIFEFKGTRYKIVTTKETWEKAAENARKEGGFIVSIESKEEQDTIWNAITNGAKIPSNYTTVMDGGGIAYIWIGANDFAEEGVWIWDGDNDGKGVNFWNGEGKNGKGNGAPVGQSYYNWGGLKQYGYANEPDNFNNAQDAAAIALEPWPKNIGFLGQAGEWNDINANNQLYYIIEYPSNNGINLPFENRNFKTEGIDLSLNSSNYSIDIRDLYGKINQISIYDLYGNLIYNQTPTTNNFRIDLSSFYSGIYTLAIKSCNDFIFQKIQVVK